MALIKQLLKCNVYLLIIVIIFIHCILPCRLDFHLLKTHSDLFLCYNFGLGSISFLIPYFLDFHLPKTHPDLFPYCHWGVLSFISLPIKVNFHNHRVSWFSCVNSLFVWISPNQFVFFEINCNTLSILCEEENTDWTTFF